MAPFSRSNMKTNDALQTNGHMMVAMARLRVLPFDLEMFSVSFPYHVLDASVMLKNEDHTECPNKFCVVKITLPVSKRVGRFCCQVEQ